MAQPKPFEHFVEKTDTCWIWRPKTGKTHEKYGIYHVHGKASYAHRMAWEKVNGPIPGGMIVHHKCKNKKCVNPEHLELTTHAEHEDAINVIHKRKTHCINGHELTPRNTYGKATWRRQCKTCTKLRNKRYKTEENKI